MFSVFRIGALLTAIGLVAWPGAEALAQHEGHADHRFNDANKWAQVFDDPARDAWQKPHEVIMALKLSPDAAVADIGAGTGYFAVRFSHMLSGGKVYAVDLEPDMVKYLGERAKKEGLANLTPVLGATDSPKIPTPVDLVIMVDVYHHIGGRERYFAQLRESLKPNGRLAIIDFRMEASMGPSKAMRIAPEQIRTELAKAGYVQAESHDFLPQQYFLVFKRSAQ
jgi:cyclopropane fatty-acyl-phospholipid synthase-like methyltransferase